MNGLTAAQYSKERDMDGWVSEDRGPPERRVWISVRLLGPAHKPRYYGSPEVRLEYTREGAGVGGGIASRDVQSVLSCWDGATKPGESHERRRGSTSRDVRTS
jgi:hypothetical protein